MNQWMNKWAGFYIVFWIIFVARLLSHNHHTKINSAPITSLDTVACTKVIQVVSIRRKPNWKKFYRASTARRGWLLVPVTTFWCFGSLYLPMQRQWQILPASAWMQQWTRGRALPTCVIAVALSSYISTGSVLILSCKSSSSSDTSTTSSANDVICDVMSLDVTASSSSALNSVSDGLMKPSRSPSMSARHTQYTQQSTANKIAFLSLGGKPSAY